MSDNWRHRSKRMKCSTCMWWVAKQQEPPPDSEEILVNPKTEGSPLVDFPQVMVLGRCRRRSPAMNGWPALFSEDWCGDHKLDETKL
jgi:hypothetical protein